MIQRMLYFPAGVFTPKNTGIFNIVLIVRSSGQVGDTDIYLKKPGTELKYLSGYLTFCRPACLRKLTKQSKYLKKIFFLARTHSKN